jgi:hypothetical protein
VDSDLYWVRVAHCKPIGVEETYDIEVENPNHSILCNNMVVHNTVSLESDIMKYIHEHPNQEGLLTTPNEAHINPLWNRMVSFVTMDTYWSSFIERCVKSPAYTMEFTNGFVLHGRISGSSQGSGLLGLHVDAAWVDEAAYYEGLGLIQLQGCFKKNCRIRLWGCPSGIKKSFLHIAWDDPAIPEYNKYRVTRYQDPTFTKEEEARLIRIYGGSKNSQQFLNQVEALDGTSSKKTFESMYYSKCFVSLLNYEVFEFNGRECQENEIDILGLDWPSVPSEAKIINITADLGYHPDPTIIGVWYTDDGGNDFLLAKVKLFNVTYTRQAEILDAIAKYFEAKNVAIDIGGPGQTVYLDLSNKERFPNIGYSPIGVDFRANIVLGYKNERDPKTGRSESVPITENAKLYSTVLIESSFENKKIVLPLSDTELYDEIDTSTKYKNNKGGYSYSGVDHNLDMIRCKKLIPFLTGSRQADEGGSKFELADF